VSLCLDLIEQAEHLATRELKKPRQASLRRAVSAAYYALFHMLIDDAVLKLIPIAPDLLRVQAQRAFTHRDMRNACEQFTKPSNPIARLLVRPVESELQTVAETFVELQFRRHSADYDLTQIFDRMEVLGIIGRARDAIITWNRVRNTPNANVFLAALLLNNRWNR
jgi:uncharacterized protein (UPF0332 family)